MTTTAKHQILIVGGGTAGITVAARMLRKGYTDVAVIEPSNTHYYQPLWTLVGGGQAKASTTERPESSVMPKQASWIKKSAAAFDPDNNTVTCADGATYDYDVLVVCPGHPARLEPHRGARGRARPRRGVVELPVRPRPTHLGLHPQHAIGHRGVHHAVRADQVRRRAAEDRLPGQRLLAKTGRAQRHRRPSRRADTAAVRHSGDRRHPRCDRRRLRHHRAHQLRGDLRRRGQLARSRSPASARAGPTPCCPTTCCTPCRASRRRTGSSPARCRPATPTATSTSTNTPCSTCGTRTCSASATPARHRTRRPAPRSASRPRSSSTTSTRS